MADQDLPEGTDTIITDDDIAGTGGTLGSSTGTTTGGAGGIGSGTYGSSGVGTDVDSDLIVGDAAGSASGADLASTSASTGSGASSAGGSTGGVKQALKSSTDKLRSTAGDRAMSFVTQGLERSSGALTNVSSIIGETAESIEQRLGPQYGDYARRAAQAIEGYAGSLSNKDPEELFEDARSVVRKSPAVALAGAAILGFALVRVVKAGLDSTGPTGASTSRSTADRD